MHDRVDGGFPDGQLDVGTVGCRRPEFLQPVAEPDPELAQRQWLGGQVHRPAGDRSPQPVRGEHGGRPGAAVTGKARQRHRAHPVGQISCGDPPLVSQGG